jgi:hypothetical protein
MFKAIWSWCDASVLGVSWSVYEQIITPWHMTCCHYGCCICLLHWQNKKHINYDNGLSWMEYHEVLESCDTCDRAAIGSCLCDCYICLYVYVVAIHGCFWSMLKPGMMVPSDSYLPDVSKSTWCDGIYFHIICMYLYIYCHICVILYNYIYIHMLFTWKNEGSTHIPYPDEPVSSTHTHIHKRII